MMKLKIKKKDCWLIAKVKIPSDFVINANQCDLLSKKFNYGFLKLNGFKRNRLEFIGPKGISLYERLKKSINEYDFFFIIEQLVDIVQNIQKIGLSCNNLVLDLKYVFFNETTKELSFIYLPIATPHSGVNILSFIEQIIYSVKPVETDTEYLSKFSYFMKSFDEFDADKVDAYIGHVDRNIVNIIKKVNIQDNVVVNNVVNNMIVNGKNQIIDDATDIMDDDATDIMIEEDEMNDSVSDNDNTLLLDNDETELFNADDNWLNETHEPTERFPTLIRTLNNEVIRINKPVFRIGKEENCVDYIVSDNIAISRSHADIISRAGKFFIFDLRSKNKSYINNRVLPAEQEVEIFNGDVLKLANEEFLFQV